IGAVGFAMPNLFGNGQRFSLDWNFGSEYRSFSISFTEPWLFNTPTLAGVSLYDLVRGGNYYGYREKRTGASFRIGRRFRWPDDYTRGDWIYRIDRSVYDQFADGFNNPRYLVEGEPRYSSSITQIMTRDSRDNPEFPTRGSVHSYSVELAGSVLQGDDQFVKQIASSEWYFPVSERLVLYSQTKYGVVYTLTGNPQDIPYVDYFFMGGSGISFGESLRGYDERSVGPITDVGDGYAVGGQTMFKHTVEARVPIIPNPTVFMLFFSDAGNVWYSQSETDLTDLKRSVGVGLRLFMPMIGLIGLDYGYGFDYLEADGSRRGRWMPHFQFGRTF
ncbi:BamA/TamA family outer membrane protein, partial [bacterium]|nr:BamA/TamA family outer membrane protein [bacterium]